MVMKQEAGYFVVRSGKGELFFILQAQSVKPSSPEKAKVVYDGGEHALLYRDTNETIILDFVPEEVKQDLERQKVVNVMECSAEDIVLMEYSADVEMVEKMPEFNLAITELSKKQEDNLRACLREMGLPVVEAEVPEDGIIRKPRVP